MHCNIIDSPTQGFYIYAMTLDAQKPRAAFNYATLILLRWMAFSCTKCTWKIAQPSMFSFSFIRSERVCPFVPFCTKNVVVIV